MVNNQAVTEATLDVKEWEGELDDADLIAVSGGNFTTELVNQLKFIGDRYSALGKAIGDAYTAEFSYNANS